MFEKVRAPDARFQDISNQIYIDFKRSNGFSDSEILDKSSSLKSILEPFSTQGNIDLLKRAGFIDYMTIYKHVNFEGFIAIK
jgi:tRNA (cmo5U34)-methyltransferase